MAFPAASPRPSEKKILSVGDLTRRIKRAVEDGVGYVWVCGEISNLKRDSQKGHFYFDLKDEESKIPCSMWNSYAERLRFEPANGLEVIAFGRVDVYLPFGRYSLVVEQMEPKGVGALQLRFEQLKEKLEKEGLFAAARKRPLPFLPCTIGIVTSPTGAAVQDMLRTIGTRCPTVHVIVYPVKVQGEGAAQEIAAAIGHINLSHPDVDVLIVGRGGGSIEDLWAFNEEVVARAIHASRIPVVSAVGHETDTTISDFVADVRALTPTDGAVRATPILDELVAMLGDLDAKIRRALRSRAELSRSQLDGFSDGRALGRIEDLPAQFAQRLDELKERLDVGAGQSTFYLRERLELLRNSLFADLPRVPESARKGVEHLTELLRARARRAVEIAAGRLREAAGKIEALSPVSILSRGYSITRLESTQEILRDAKSASPGDRLITRLGSGELRSRVEGDESSR